MVQLEWDDGLLELYEVRASERFRPDEVGLIIDANKVCIAIARASLSYANTRTATGSIEIALYADSAQAFRAGNNTTYAQSSVPAPLASFGQLSSENHWVEVLSMGATEMVSRSRRDFGATGKKEPMFMMELQRWRATSVGSVLCSRRQPFRR
jgi:hypothetical protein